MKIHKIYREILLKSVLKKVNFKPEDAILIFSDPRGGSTWLTELMLNIPKSAVIWEPLHLSFNPSIDRLGFSWRQFIPEEAIWQEAKEEMDRILSGKVLNADTTFLNKSADYKIAENLIVKFCRGNALLPWMVKNYQFRYLPILFLRHPFSVVASQMKQGGWNYSFSGFEIPDGKYNEIYMTHKEFLKTIKSKEESLIAYWCIINKIPLNHDNNDAKWMVVHYEKLFLNPKIEIERIFRLWNLPIPDGIINNVAINSKTTVSEVEHDNKEQQLAKWKHVFSKKQIDRFLEILDYFEISVYGEGLMPIE